MGKEAKKLSKGRLSAILLVLVLLVVIVTLVIVFKDSDTQKLLENHLTSEELEEKAIEAVNRCQYSTMLLDQQITLTDDTKLLEEYMISAEKDGSKRTYTYISTDGSMLMQYWEKELAEDGEAEHYDVYIYSESYETWVNTKLESEPIVNDLWSMLTSMHEYTILEDKQEWYVTGEECYVLQLLGSSDSFYAIYEEMYINAETLLPVGIVEYCVAEEEGSKTIDDLTEDDLNINLDGYTAENIEVESSNYSEILRVYQLNYSNEDMAMFDKPETFITDEDYMYLEYTYNQDEEAGESVDDNISVENNESSNEVVEDNKNGE